MRIIPSGLQSIWGGTFKDEKAGLQQKFSERGVVSSPCRRAPPTACLTRRRCRLECVIPERIPTAASSSSLSALLRSSTVPPRPSCSLPSALTCYFSTCRKTCRFRQSRFRIRSVGADRGSWSAVGPGRRAIANSRYIRLRTAALARCAAAQTSCCGVGDTVTQ